MAALVILLDVLFLALPDNVLSETENRNLQQFPRLTWNTVTSGRFESQFDTYIADQFPFRDAWVRLETTVLRLEGYTESQGVFLGKDGYLIQKFEEPDEEKFQSILNSFTEISSGHEDLSLYAVVVPGAVSILSELLPANAEGRVAGDEDAFLDRLYEALQEYGIRTIDVRDTLKELSGKGTQVYYRTDHHWTTDAACAVYQVFAEEAGLPESGVEYDRVLATDQFQGTLTASSGFRTGETDSIYVYLPREESLEESQYEYIVTNVDTGEKRASLYDSSYLETRDKYGLFLGGNHGELKIQTSSGSQQKILVLKDSYANCLIPFLVPDYSSIVVVDPRYFYGDLDQLISDEEITDILFLYSAGTL